jgi:hypothetical protein
MATEIRNRFAQRNRFIIIIIILLLLLIIATMLLR